MHQSEVERGRASDRLLARLSDVWKERDVDERSINDFGLVLMSRKEEKEEGRGLTRTATSYGGACRPAGHTRDQP